MIKAVIMAGGSGTRLWPLSRAAHPKQFFALHGKGTMLQNTVKRLSGLDVQSSVVICNEEHRFFVAEQLREIDKLDAIILEPVGKNTAPAIALAALLAREDDPLLLVLAADHVVQDEVMFTKAVCDALPLAESGKLVTFGIVPQDANTGYGYIKRGEPQNTGFIVDQFVEKPSSEVAKNYLASGEYYWNSGMFLFKASRYLEELKKFRLDIYQACESAMEDADSDLDFLRINKDKFEACPSESIDYAVMEHTADALVVPLDAGWSDIGSWDALWQISEKDEHNNTLVGDAVVHDVEGSLVWSESRLVSVVGLKDVIVVETADAVMVASQDQAQDVKSIVNHLKGSGRIERTFHRKVYRPWGYYEGLDAGPAFQVKRLGVNPGASLSLQLHHHRAEHWVVVSGVATVTVGEKVFDLNPNESCYIPLETRHRLQNLTEEPLEICLLYTSDAADE